MSQRKFRLIPEEMYQKLIKDDPSITSEYDTERVNQKQMEEKQIQELKVKGNVADEMEYLNVLYKHPDISWCKDYTLKHKNVKIGVNLFDAVRFLNNPSQSTVCSIDLLKLCKIMYESNALKSTFTCKDANDKEYMFHCMGYWGGCEDFADKWAKFKDE